MATRSQHFRCWAEGCASSRDKQRTESRMETFARLVDRGVERGAVWSMFVTPNECAYTAAALPWTTEARLCELVLELALSRMSDVAKQTHEAEPESWPSCSNYPEVFAVDRAAGPPCFSCPQEPKA